MRLFVFPLEREQRFLHRQAGGKADERAVGADQTDFSVPNLLVELMTLFADGKAPPIR